MGSVNVRRGVTQAKQNESAGAIIGLDAAVLAGFAWYSTGSWSAGLVSFLVVAIVLNLIARSEKLANLFSLACGVIWGVGGYYLAKAFEATDLNAMIVGVFVGLCACGAHVQGMQHLNDLSNAKHEE